MAELIYKYTTLNSALDILENNSVKLEFPRYYNDPFDAQINFDEKEIEKAKSVAKEYIVTAELYKQLCNMNVKLSTKDKFAIWIAKKTIEFNFFVAKKTGRYEPNPVMQFFANYAFHKGGFESTFEQHFLEVLDKTKAIREKTLVSCFSKTNESLLMWSHYADSHEGVCIEFERPDGFYDIQYKKQSLDFDVSYAIERTISIALLNGDKTELDNDSVLLKPFYTKALDWAYEKEVRCIYNLDNNKDQITEKKFVLDNGEEETMYLHNMPYNIKRVYVGCKVDKESVEYQELKKMADERHIVLIDMIIDRKNYKVNCKAE